MGQGLGDRGRAAGREARAHECNSEREVAMRFSESDRHFTRSESERPMDPFKAFPIVAGISAAGSVLIVLVPLQILNRISDGGMWAIAAMVAAPAIMGIGVSYFISRTSSGVPRGSESKGSKDDALL